jgi:hypothetical protein
MPFFLRAAPWPASARIETPPGDRLRGGVSDVARSYLFFLAFLAALGAAFFLAFLAMGFFLELSDVNVSMIAA